MLVAQDPPTPVQRVLVQLARRRMLAERMQGLGKLHRRHERVGMVGTEHASAPVQAVLAQLTGLLVLAEHSQVVGQRIAAIKVWG